MFYRFLAGLMLFVSLSVPGSVLAQDVATLSRYAGLALDCVHQEYPNKIGHVMTSDDDVGPPRELTPVFYGCFDWHSSVHGHWLLTRLLHLYPDAEFAPAAEAALMQSFVAERVVGELRYLAHEERASFERPYGVAWFLQLMAELREWQDPRATQWLAVLEPMESVFAANMKTWLEKLAYPIRIGEHAQTAFAFGLFLDWARSAGQDDFHALVKRRSKDFYLGDRNCPLSYEPSGHDFLSPCIAEADLMRRIMTSGEYAVWLSTFMPQIPTDGSAGWLEIGVVTDPADGKLAHLDGLNISRAWMLEGMAAGLPASDKRRAAILGAAKLHRESGLASVTGEHYEGGHWLGSFATYLQTARGLDDD